MHDMVDLFSQLNRNLPVRFTQIRLVTACNVNVVDQWFTTNIKKFIFKRDIGSGVYLSLHPIKIISVTQQIKSATRIYYGNRLNLKYSLKKLWSNLQDIGIVSSNNSLLSSNANDFREHLSNGPLLMAV